MLIEAEAIPFEPTLLRGERLLILAPHPDDEVIGCGGLLAQHVREKRPVRVVVLTDGAEAGQASVREQESRRALETIGSVEAEFLRFPDRGLGDEASSKLREQLLDFRPDLILVPGPVEMHPDHLALCRIFCELVQRDPSLFAELAVARVAFYEVSQPLRPNAIVDITDVAELKYSAIAQHSSQTAVRDYVGYARGLNAYRAMTLPEGAQYAEAYLVVDLPSLRTTPFSALTRMAGTARPVEVTRETLPVSVVIRTKDRPELLQEAIDSVRAGEYPCEIVVVNDGGAPLSLEGVRLIEHEQSRGRAEAANAGVRAAGKAFLAFLDDDDLFHPEHLSTLTAAARSSHVAWYSDAVSSFLRTAESGRYESHAKMRLFAHDFDRELLLLDNYIPLPTLLLRRDQLLDAGGFDPAFDLFEDWDLLIRLSQKGDFLRIPRVTCEIRHFEGGSSIVLAAPEGSGKFRRAKLQVWEKHAALIDNDVIANVFESQKRLAMARQHDLVTARGELAEAHRAAGHQQRERSEVQDQLNGYMLRVRELEGSVAVLQPLARELAEVRVLADRYQREIEELRAANVATGAVLAQTREELGRTRVEIERLNGLLNMIYNSRTWKLHTLVEKARGRR